MKEVHFLYGKTAQTYAFSEAELAGVLTSGIGDYKPVGSPEELVARAMEAPEGGCRLDTLAKGKRNIVIIASDHTRPVPSKVIIPTMLKQIRSARRIS